MKNLDFLRKYQDQDGCVAQTMLDIDEDLTNLCWLPIPEMMIQPDDWSLFWQLWNSQKIPMTRFDRESAIWDSLCIWKSPEISDQEVSHFDYPQAVTDWTKHFPKMFEMLFSAMPYEEIWKITLGSNTARVPAHVDPPQFGTSLDRPKHGTLYPWPNSVRVLLHDQNPRPTFYLTPWPEELLHQGKIKDFNAIAEWGMRKEPSQDRKCYVKLPRGTNTFVFSNGEFLHGADYCGNEKILLLVWGKPHEQRWKKRLKSIKTALDCRAGDFQIEFGLSGLFKN